MRLSELDLEQDLWVIPAERMKSGKEHLVPLTNPLKDLFESLRKIYGDEEFVFLSPPGFRKVVTPLISTTGDLRA